MIVVFAIDALEHKLVETYSSKNLMQKYYGKTDISEFSEPRTMVLWSSFMTCQNKEEEVLVKGDKEMWNTRWPIEETFFKNFENPKILDLPGYNYDLKIHEESRLLLKKYFMTKNEDEKEQVKKKYNKEAFDHHRNIKEEFLKQLDSDVDFLLGYFSLADVVGHLNFGNSTLMRMIYKDLDEIGKTASEKADKMLVISDHGMFDLGGGFGDHSEYGFFSTSWESEIQKPKITEFGSLLSSLK